MKLRFIVITAAVIAAMLPVSAPVDGQETTKAGSKVKAWAPTRTPDGQPDLQGTWSNISSVPLERPKNLGAKEFYTPEEMAQNAKRAQEKAAKAAQGRDTEPGTRADVHYDLGQFGLDAGHTQVAANTRTSLIIGPEGRIPELLPEAQKRAADRAARNRGHQFDAAEYRGLSERCIVWPNEPPPMVAGGYNGNIQIVQGPGYVGIMQEMIHDMRIVPLDGRPHLPANIHQWLGDSRGHWEGNTLVVDTTNFTGETAFHGSGENLHVIERFTRTGEKSLMYEFTVSDPTTWEKSWTAQIPWARADAPIFEYACQEGNYGMANILSQTRAEEKEAAEAAAKKDPDSTEMEGTRRGNSMQGKLAVAVAGAMLFLAAAPVWAHHAFYAEFDENKPITLKGTVTKWELVNPHSWIHLDVKGPDGKITSWMIEGGSPNALLRLGFTKDSLPPGTEIVVNGYQAKGGAIRAVGKDLTFADGKRLFMGGSAPGATPGEGAEGASKK